MFGSSFFNPEDKLKDRMEYQDTLVKLNNSVIYKPTAIKQYKKNDIRYFMKPKQANHM